MSEAKTQIILQFQKLVNDYEANNVRIAELQVLKDLYEKSAQDLHAAARVFNFDIISELSKMATPASPASKTIIEAPKLPRPSSIKEFILEEIRGSHPKPVRASHLRGKLAKAGKATHEKSIGMTLYRLSVEGKVRRDGWDWYYVDQPVLEGVMA